MSQAYAVQVVWYESPKAPALPLFELLERSIVVDQFDCNEREWRGRASGYGCGGVSERLHDWAQLLANHLGCHLDVSVEYEGGGWGCWEVAPESAG